jgi:hypothetical protein
MLTLKRHFDSSRTALRAHGGATEIAFAGMRQWGNSPVFGVLPTH